ncbi:DUF1295 domain-containing protein [Eudoraea sp.]|uniref:DUF1295 domain-containing protein n=1 Tax=Eudoraea sp. TaxID=1979955 RepID=UPI003C73FA13
MNLENFNLLNYIWIGIALITFLALVIFDIRAPYGRHTSEKWGMMVSNRWGWFWMELPAFLLFPILVFIGPREKDWLTWLLVGLWTLHYFNRTFVFPFRLKTSGKKMPLTIVFSAIFFNGINGFLNGYYLGYLAPEDQTGITLNIVIGLLLFFGGMYINNRTDSRLISLRKEKQGYSIPQGWLFKWISCPNHFGEIIEWIGFAVVAWNLPALTFAVWTFCNLVPRALNHHAWYHENFKEYPTKRKAVIPGLW